MNVFITGATGVLGRRLVRQFVARGHFVKGLARNEKGQQLVDSLGGVGVLADHFDPDSLSHAADQSEVVIHAATSIPSRIRPSAKHWKPNDRLRRQGTRALATCAARIGARLYIQQSIVWVARPPDGSHFEESSRHQPEMVFASALDGEQIAIQGGQKHGFRVAVLRCGSFYSADSIHTRMLGKGLMKRQIPIVGKGDAVWALLHADDAAGAFLAAAEGNQNGLWHVVDDTPVSVDEYFREFARQLSAPSPYHVPVWLAKLVLGSFTARQFTCSTQTSNALFKRDFPWMPEFSSFREGIRQIVQEWDRSKIC